MNRRQFLVGSTAVAGVSLLPISLAGCSQDQLADLVNTLGTAAANLADLEGNTALANKLQVDVAAAANNVRNWKKGSAVDMAIEAMNLVEDDLYLIPIANQYAPLITLTIGTVEAILSMLPHPVAPPATQARRHRRAVQLAHPAPVTAKDFKKQWNAICVANPTLTPVIIK